MRPRIMGTEMEYSVGDKQNLPISKVPALPDYVVAINDYLANGARFYVDMGHKLEYASPECAGAYDATHAEFSGERIVFDTYNLLVERNILDPAVMRKCVIDDDRNTWGYHMNFSVQAKHFENERYRQFLAGHMATMAVMVGAGTEVFTETGYEIRPWQKLAGAGTGSTSEVFGSGNTREKALVSTKSESHNLDNEMARQHLTAADPNLTARMTLLKLGSTSLVMRLYETGMYDLGAVRLQSPLQAAQVVARDASLKDTFRLANDRQVTAVNVQESYLEQAESMAERYGVPRDERQTLAIWREVVDLLGTDRERAAEQVEWLGMASLLGVEIERRGLRQHADIAKLVRAVRNGWSHMDPDKNIGRRWMSQYGHEILDEDLVDRFIESAPPGTRATKRGRFIKRHSKQAQQLPKTSSSISWTEGYVGTSRFGGADLYDDGNEDEAA